MTHKSLLVIVAVLGLSSTGSSAVAQTRELFAGNLPTDLGALPTRARKSAAPEITVPLKLEALRSEARPHLKTALFLPEDVVRLVGAGFGQEAAGRTIELKLSGASVTLTVLSWSDQEVRVQLPDLEALGIDAKEGALRQAELDRSKKNVAGPSVELGIMGQDGRWVARRTAQIAVAVRDFDADGAEANLDCDDYDPRRAPSLREVYDPAGVDEDCNEKTVAKPPEPTVDEALAGDLEL